MKKLGSYYFKYEPNLIKIEESVEHLVFLLKYILFIEKYSDFQDIFAKFSIRFTYSHIFKAVNQKRYSVFNLRRAEISVLSLWYL